MCSSDLAAGARLWLLLRAAVIGRKLHARRDAVEQGALRAALCLQRRAKLASCKTLARQTKRPAVVGRIKGVTDRSRVDLSSFSGASQNLELVLCALLLSQHRSCPSFRHKLVVQES